MFTIQTLANFVTACKGRSNYEIYQLFEFHTPDAVRNEIYNMADPDSGEPVRNAMHKLGFITY